MKIWDTLKLNFILNLWAKHDSMSHKFDYIYKMVDKLIFFNYWNLVIGYLLIILIIE
jgi:hypothetical protein